ncbi:hypothetical protein [Streptomyces sp. NPDC049881]|uniref:hypothetical protein n=1 Tax=unclassified Streptomyces TaxID=2593676 RepID=UPI0034403DAA
MSTRLGPLELSGGRWVVGDLKRAGGSCFVLADAGLEHRRPGPQETRTLIPWPRFRVLHLRATRRTWLAARPLGMLNGASAAGPVGGPSACSMAGLLRDPYEYWTVGYSHHRREYDHKDIYLAGHLFPIAVKAGAADRLGDPEWVGDVVARLTELRGLPYEAAGREATGIVREYATCPV